MNRSGDFRYLILGATDISRLGVDEAGEERSARPVGRGDGDGDQIIVRIPSRHLNHDAVGVRPGTQLSHIGHLREGKVAAVLHAKGHLTDRGKGPFEGEGQGTVLGRQDKNREKMRGGSRRAMRESHKEGRNVFAHVHEVAMG